jgi:c-di-GMP-binding flagellar brake protein YcgR
VDFFARASGVLAPGSPGAGPTQAGDRTLTDAQRICHILTRLCEARVLVTVQVPGVEDAFLSTVLQVDPRRRRLALDELTPAAGHEALLRSRSLRAMTRLAGVDVSFQATVDAVSSEDGIAAYTLPFPDRVHYNQRRGDYRVAVGPGQRLSVQFDCPDGTRLRGEVRDLSIGGLAIRVQIPDEWALENGTRIAECEVVFPDGRSVPCELEVRHAERAEGSRWTRVGARFVDLPRHQQHLIARFIVNLDRERLKLRPTSGRTG